jgi:hypothetical protein
MKFGTCREILRENKGKKKKGCKFNDFFLFFFNQKTPHKWNINIIPF